MKLLSTILLLIFSVIASSQTCNGIPLDSFKYSPDLIENGNISICYVQYVDISTRNLGQQWCTSNNWTLPVSGRVRVQPNTTTKYELWSIRKSNNLITNGNFSAGNTGFKTDYATGNYHLYDEQYLNVVTNATAVHPRFRDCPDHTSPPFRGNMLVVNGGYTPNNRVWYQEITVAPNTQYDLSFWSQAVNNGGGKLRFYIDDKPLDSAIVPAICEWKQKAVKWYSANSTKVEISIIDEDLSGGDNDFALDDITMSATYYEYDVLVLEVSPKPRTIVDTIRSCNGQPTGTYRDTLRDAQGCDTLYRVHHVINDTNIPAIKTCEFFGCNSYTFRDSTYTRSTTLSDTIKSRFGCDSLITNNKIIIGKIIPKVQGDTVFSCSYLQYQGNWIFSPTTFYLDTLMSVGGCDSVYIIKHFLIGRPVQLFSNPIFSCMPVVHEGKLYTKSTNLYDTIKSAGQCDSIINFVEIIVGSPVKVINDTNITCLPTRNYSDTLRSLTGCDSLIINTVYLTPPVKIETIYKVECSGNSTGTYRDTLRYTTGCDSLITTTYLTVKPTYYYNTGADICPGGSVDIKYIGIVTKAGTYRDTIKYASGCDSLIIRAVITQRQARLENTSIQACEPYTLPSGRVVTTTGNYSDTLKAKAGCDSVVTRYKITFNFSPFKISKSNDVNCNKGYAELTASGSNVVWSTGEKGNRITVMPVQTTTYRATIKTASCTYTDSITVTVSKDGNSEINIPNAFTPNGDGKNDCFSVKSIGAVQDLSFSIYSRWGERLFFTQDASKCWDGSVGGVKQSSGTFVYHFTGKSLCGNIDKKGTIVLIR